MHRSGAGHNSKSIADILNGKNPPQSNQKIICGTPRLVLPYPREDRPPPPPGGRLPSDAPPPPTGEGQVVRQDKVGGGTVESTRQPVQPPSAAPPHLPMHPFGGGGGFCYVCLCCAAGPWSRGDTLMPSTSASTIPFHNLQ